MANEITFGEVGGRQWTFRQDGAEVHCIVELGPDTVVEDGECLNFGDGKAGFCMRLRFRQIQPVQLATWLTKVCFANLGDHPSTFLYRLSEHFKEWAEQMEST